VASRSKNQRRTPARQHSQTVSTRRRPRTVDPDDFDDIIEDIEDAETAPNDDNASQDPSLTLFLRRPPSGATHVVVIACTSSGEQVIQDRDAAEAREPAELADLLLDSCGRWAATEGRKTRFRLCWQIGDRTLASHQIVAGEGDPGALDGTVNSFLQQQQRHAETTHRLSHDGFQMVQSSWEKLQRASMQRIEALEKDNHELRERLRKAGDVEAEIAYSTVAADIEQRQRTTEIIEARVLPIVQQAILARMGLGGVGNADEPALLTTLKQLMAAAPKQPEEGAHEKEPDSNARAAKESTKT